MKKIILISCLLTAVFTFGQQDSINSSHASASVPERKFIESGDLKINLNPAGDRWLKFGVNSQIWFRDIENNPGTAVNGVAQDNTYDAGIRRMRITIQSQVTPYYSVFLQLGINNQSFISGGGTGTGANGAGKKAPFFFHDAYNEFTIIPRENPETKKTNKFNLYVGGGLHSWNGVSRLTNASSTKILAADLPIFNFPNIETSDQFARQLGLFVHGDLDRVNYRFSINKPFATNLIPAANGVAVENNQSGKLSYSGYAFYQFFAKESTPLSFLSGNYLGAKKYLSVGAGFYTNNNATLSQPIKDSFESHNSSILGLDLNAELPVGDKSEKMGLTLYSVFYKYNYGPNFIRYSGIMNPGTVDSAFGGQRALEGVGNSKVLLGTGNVWYTQMGFALPKFSNVLQIQPYATYARKDLDALNEIGNYYDLGANFFIHGTNARIALNYASRPIYNPTTKQIFDRKGEFLMVFQIVL